MAPKNPVSSMAGMGAKTPEEVAGYYPESLYGPEGPEPVPSGGKVTPGISEMPDPFGNLGMVGATAAYSPQVGTTTVEDPKPDPLLMGQMPQQAAGPMLDPNKRYLVGGSGTSMTTTQKGMAIDPEVYNRLDATSKAAFHALDARAGAEDARGQARAVEAQKYAADMQKVQAEHQVRRADYMAQVEQVEAQAKKIRDEVAQAHVDPNRWVARRNPLQMLGIFIGMAMEKFGQAMMGHPEAPSSVMQMVQQQIDRDIDAQKQDIANKRGALADTRNLLGDMWRKVKDEDVAAQMTRQVMLDKYKIALQELDDKVEGPRAKALIAQLKTGMVQADTKLKMGLYDMARDKVTIRKGGSSRYASGAALMAKGKGGQKQMQRQELEIFRPMASFLDTVKEARRQLRNLKGSYGGWQYIPESEANQFKNRYLKGLTTRVARLMGEKGNMAVWDSKRYTGILEGPLKRMSDVDGGLKFIFNDTKRAMARGIKMYSRSYDMTPVIEQYREIVGK